MDLQFGIFEETGTEIRNFFMNNIAFHYNTFTPNDTTPFHLLFISDTFVDERFID